MTNFNSFWWFKEEEFDKQNVQISPPGFHVIYLPFADDFRKVKFEEQPKGETKQKFKRFFVKLKYFIQIILLQMQILS